MKLWPALVLAFIASNSIAQTGASDSVGTSEPKNPGAFSTQNMQVHNAKGSSFIAGTLRNISGKSIADATITFEVYDEDGADLGHIIAHQKNIPAGGSWELRATPESNLAFSKAKISTIELR
jgi:hypothetical protein